MAVPRDDVSEGLGGKWFHSVRYEVVGGSNEIVSAILDEAMKRIIIDAHGDMENFIGRSLLADDDPPVSEMFSTLQIQPSRAEVPEVFSVPPPEYSSVPPHPFQWSGVFSVPPPPEYSISTQRSEVHHISPPKYSPSPESQSVPSSELLHLPCSEPRLPHNSLFRKFDPNNLPLSSNSHGRTRSRQPSCAFCKKNGESPSVWRSHKLREGGKVTCPHLRRKVCQLCGATGDTAHTVTFCPLNTRALPVTSMLRHTARTSDGRARRTGGGIY